MNLQKELRSAITTGNVVLGSEQALKKTLNGGAKLVIVSSNCPNIEEFEKGSEGSGVKLYKFNKNSVELGSTCKKPFAISALAIIDEGESKVLDIE
jgi:large subunit ribosomal protein L30e